jgi:hypothetical protein
MGLEGVTTCCAMAVEHSAVPIVIMVMIIARIVPTPRSTIDPDYSTNARGDFFLASIPLCHLAPPAARPVAAPTVRSVPMV